MWKIVLVCAIMVGSATSAQRKRYINSGRQNYAPDYGFIDPFEFHQKLTQQILAQQGAQNNAFTSIYASDDASAFAEASNYPDYDELFQEQFNRQQAFFDNIRRQSAGAAGGHSSGGYAPNYASASGSFGNNGFTQSASIHPENPGLPNINNRFSESTGGNGGHRGVSVSSYSSSSDVNGKKTNHRGASTTINDNGKITSYQVHS